MPFEPLWRAFLHADAGVQGSWADLFAIYVHPPPDFSYPPESLFHGREVPDRVAVEWGQHSVVSAVCVCVCGGGGVCVCVCVVVVGGGLARAAACLNAQPSGSGLPSRSGRHSKHPPAASPRALRGSPQRAGLPAPDQDCAP